MGNCAILSGVKAEVGVMKVWISLKRVIQSMIIFFMVLAIVIIWPLKIIRPYFYEGELNKDSDVLVQNEGTIMQEFSVTRPELSFIELYIYNEDLQEPEGELVYRLFDENLNKVDEKSFSIDRLKIPGICKIKIRGDLEVGRRYYFSIENPGAELLFSMSDGVNLDARYGYHTYFSKLNYALYALTVLLVGGVCLVLAERMTYKQDRLYRCDSGIRLGLSLILTTCSLWLAFNVFPLCKFTTDWINIVFYEIGIFLFIAIMLYGLLHRREKEGKEKISIKEVEQNVPAILQTLAFSGVIAGTINYVNAAYIHYQKTAMNTILVCFALAIIAGFKKKELFNWYNLVYFICAVGGSVFYCIQNGTDEATLELAKGSAAVVSLWGGILLDIVHMLVRHKQYGNQKVSKIYAASVILLLGAMVCNRNTREWPIEIAIFFGLFALEAVGKGKTRVYLDTFINGVFVNFVCVSIYSILYRPFYAYRLTRYSSVFHTGTVAALYDGMVLTLALARFFFVYYKKGTLKAAWKELCLMGVAGAFLLLTVSRTALLMFAVVGGGALIVTSLCQYKDGFIGILKRLGITVGGVLIFFVIVFTGCRLVPAVASKPFAHDIYIEKFEDAILSGEEWDSKRFVTIQRFLQVVADKFGVETTERGGENTATGGNNSQSEPSLTGEEKAVKGEDVVEKIDEFSSGRIQIFKDYLAYLSWEGHETIELIDENGKAIQGHAHNSYIQTAYDFGIGTGIGFLLFCIYVCLRSLFYYIKHLDEINGLSPMMIAGAFCVSSMVEWVFQLHIPLGFAFLLIWVVLIPAERKGNEKDN